MKMRKKLFMGVIVLLIIWLLITVFFYYQHQVYVESYDIGEYIEFDDFGVFISNIEKYDYKNKDFKYPDFILGLDLPGKLSRTILNIKYFYSIPYEIDKENPKFDINCEVIVHGEYGISVDVGDLLKDKLDIQYISTPSDSIIYLAGTRITASGNQNVIQLTYSGEWNDVISEGIRIVDIVDDEKHNVDFELPFTKVRYDYFNRRPGYRQDYSSSIISDLLSSYCSGDRLTAESYISTEHIDTFSWDILDLYCEFSAQDFIFSYIGQYKEAEDVFMMNTGGYIEGESIDELVFYMIYDDFRWQIIDVDAVY